MDEQRGFYLEDLKVGMSAAYTKTVTDADLVLFAGVSGDINPMHVDQEYARKTMFQGRIAHGMLTASFISAVLGTKLPGPGCIYVSQNLKFKAPVRPGDTVRAKVTVKAIDLERGRVTVDTVCSVADKPVIEGEAVLMVPRKALPKAAE
jgi:3-hydroxybutyryl-CoA dehydratase